MPPGLVTVGVVLPGLSDVLGPPVGGDSLKVRFEPPVGAKVFTNGAGLEGLTPLGPPVTGCTQLGKTPVDPSGHAVRQDIPLQLVPGGHAH